MGVNMSVKSVPPAPSAHPCPVRSVGEGTLFILTFFGAQDMCRRESTVVTTFCGRQNADGSSVALSQMGRKIVPALASTTASIAS